MTPPPTHQTRIPAAVWALGFVSLLADIGSEMVHSLLPVFLVTVAGASMVTVGLIEGVAESTALIVKVFSGALSDYIGKRKPLALLGYALGAASKPLFAVAGSADLVFGARLIDRIGKGIRGAPRDALVADIAPPNLRGAAFGLRQSLDTVGAFAGPLLAAALMLLWANDFKAVFWVATIPAALSVAVLALGVREPAPSSAARRGNPIRRENLVRLTRAYWWVVAIGAALTLARFSEAFLVLRLHQGGLALAHAPLVLVAMNAVYAVCAYPFGKLADRTDSSTLLGWGIAALLAADAMLAWSNHWTWGWAGVCLWGAHLAMTQGLLAAMVARTAPADLRGTAFGLFNLASGASMLVASTVAGAVWHFHGAPATFAVGTGFGLVALLLLFARPADRS
ncbi:MAG: MFS transporter [Ramlibacter sp.]|nr:MFS transporter [Ramlibacter sp.]